VDPLTLILGAAAAFTTISTIFNSINNVNNAYDQAKAAGYTREQLKYKFDELNTDWQTNITEFEGYINDAERQMQGLYAAQKENKVEIEKQQFDISAYQRWIDNYSEYYATETGKARAGINQYKAEGQSNYEALLGTMSTVDAVAGATGRAAAGTSMAMVGQKARQNTVDYVGEDMTLDMNGGIYGEQLTSYEMQYRQLERDLNEEYISNSTQLSIAQRSLANLMDADAMYSQYINQFGGELDMARANLNTWISEGFNWDSEWKSQEELEREEYERMLEEMKKNKPKPPTASPGGRPSPSAPSPSPGPSDGYNSPVGMA
jgi:chromosome segregation ATPase